MMPKNLVVIISESFEWKQTYAYTINMFVVSIEHATFCECTFVRPNIFLKKYV